MSEGTSTATRLLSVTGLGKRFGFQWVFRSVSFALELGQVMIVTGPNGSGKSTLLQLVAGLQEPSAGKIGMPDIDRRSFLAYAAIDQAVYPSLTVHEHFQLAGTLRGCEPRTQELIDLIGLGHAAERLASQLSTGMRARLKLALAIQPMPSILLLDEPGAGLDESGRELIARIIDEQRKRGAAMVATNDAAERRFGDSELKLAG